MSNHQIQLNHWYNEDDDSRAYYDDDIAVYCFEQKTGYQFELFMVNAAKALVPSPVGIDQIVSIELPVTKLPEWNTASEYLRCLCMVLVASCKHVYMTELASRIDGEPLIYESNGSKTCPLSIGQVVQHVTRNDDGIWTNHGLVRIDDILADPYQYQDASLLCSVTFLDDGYQCDRDITIKTPKQPYQIK